MITGNIMKITESRFRQIIREEARAVLREGPLDIFSEPTLQDNTIDVTSKLKYIAARQVGGATPSGAAAIAKGQVAIMPSAAEALEIGWKSSLMGDTLTALGAIASCFPGGGTVINAALAGVAITRALSIKDWLSVVLGGLSLIPAVGRWLGMLANAAANGIKGASLILPALAAAFTSITQFKVISLIESIVNINSNVEAEVGKAYTKLVSEITAAAAAAAPPPSKIAVASGAAVVSGAAANIATSRRSSRMD